MHYMDDCAGSRSRSAPREPAIRDGDRYQPMWPELEALVGSRDARDESPCGALAALAE